MVLVSSEIGTNTADPRIEPALSRVGIVNNGESGVYLGNYQNKSWVLTANHVGPGSFELGGITYSAVAGSAHQLLNPDSTPSDFLLFQIDGDPAANRVGYRWTGVQPGLKRWGSGSVAGSTHGVNQTRAFCTKFLDQRNNACAMAGDSGGGVFIRQGCQWQLVGMIDALSGLTNQPAGTSILNGDINVIADLSQERSKGTGR